MLEGGCLCGAVRYCINGKPYHLTHCHCATCRRASAAAFVTWFSLKADEFELLLGAPAQFASSRNVVRTFCARCGTPLTYRQVTQSEEIDITVCSLDHPAALMPEDHTWVSSRLPWVKTCDGLREHARTRNG